MIEMKHKQTTKGKKLYRNFSRFMFHHKIRFWVFRSDLKNKIQYNKYCKKEYHKISSGYTSTTNSKKETKEVHYMQCSICKTKWFVSKEDKKLYKEIKESYDDMMTFHLKAMMGKLTNGK